MSIDTRARDLRDEVDAMFVDLTIPNEAHVRRRLRRRNITHRFAAGVAVLALAGGVATTLPTGGTGGELNVTAPGATLPDRILAIDTEGNLVEVGSPGADDKIVVAADDDGFPYATVDLAPDGAVLYGDPEPPGNTVVREVGGEAYQPLPWNPALSPDRRAGASAAWSGEQDPGTGPSVVEIRDLDDPAPPRRVPIDGAVALVAWSRDGSAVHVLHTVPRESSAGETGRRPRDQGRVVTLDAATGEVLDAFDVEDLEGWIPYAPRSGGVLADGRLLTKVSTGKNHELPDGSMVTVERLVAIDPATGEVATLRNDLKGLNAVAIAADGEHVLYSTHDGLFWFDLEGGAGQLSAARYNAVAW
jgi:hypothetical protein